MQVKHVAAAAILALGAASAQAITSTQGVTLTFNPNLGTVGTAEEYFGGGAVFVKGSFNYAYNFTLDNKSSLTGDLDKLFGKLTFTGVSIGGTSAALSPDYSFSFADMAAGTYTMLVSLNSTSWKHGWSGSLVAQPVPEPQSVAMLLAGLGLMGAVAARRRRYE